MKKTIFKIMSLALTVALLASLIVGVMPAGALSIISVAGSDETISANDVEYVITFTGALNLVDAVDTITVTFPTAFDITGYYGIKFDNGEGDIASPYAIDDSAVNAGILTITPDYDAMVGFPWVITIGGIDNPDVAGSYTVSVYTSKEPTPVVSPVIRIGSPGIVQYYNAAGAYLGTVPFLADLPVIQDGWTIKVGSGMYFAFPLIIEASDVTFTSTGGAMIIGNIIVNGADCTLSNFTKIGEGIDLNGPGATLENISFGKYNRVMAGEPPPASVDETLLFVDGDRATITGCAFDLSTPAGFQDTGINVDGTDTTIENCTFKVDQTPGYYPDYAIDAGDADNTIIEKNKFTGSSGWGVYTSEGTGDIDIANNTFTGLEVAVYVEHNEYFTNIYGNTISGSTVNGTNYLGAIHIEEVCCEQVLIYDNTIKDNDGYSVYVDVVCCYWDNAFVFGNNFSNNAKGLANADGDEPVDAVLNYWGDAGGPGVGDADKVSGDVVYEPFLTVPNTKAYAYNVSNEEGGNSPAAAKDAGFSIRNYEFVDGWVIGQTLSGNPAPTEPPFPAIAYFDIYTSDPTDDAMQVSLYAEGLTAASNVYYWSGAAAGWKLCSNQALAGSGAYVYFTVAPAAATGPFSEETAPAPDELQALSFVIVDGIAPPAAEFNLSPVGTEGVTGLSGIPFAWSGVPGATGYRFVIWTTDPNSPVVDENTGSPSFMVGSLPAGSYFWQVFAMQGENVIGQSGVGTFVAQAPPSTSTAPPITITTQPPATITFTQPAPTTLTITQPAAPAPITPAWIWGIIGIGAILVIVVIVLIVRTRRTT
jgi:hypothetical protein